MVNNEVFSKRLALKEAINRVSALVKELKFQEADEGLPKVQALFVELSSILDLSKEIHRNILENSKMKLNILCQMVQNGLDRRESGKKEEGNIAFKCNWNDKGYKHVCSDLVYKFNQVFGGPWCSVSRCRQFKSASVPPLDCCYESRALTDYNFGAGWDHGPKGELISPRKIKSPRIGKIAFLTTQPQNSEERFVFGAFRITTVMEDPGKETFLFGDKESALDDMLRYKIRFWDYHRNPNNPSSKAWSTGLFRYVSDMAALGILEDYLGKRTANGEDISKVEKLIGALKASCTVQ